MRKQFCILIAMLFVAIISFAQQKKIAPTKTPTISKFEQLVKATKFPYQLSDDSTAIFPFEGKNIAEFDVQFSKVDDEVLLYVSLSKYFPDKLDDSKCKYLLEKAAQSDFIKMGLRDGKLSMMINVYWACLTKEKLVILIQQISEVVDSIAGDLK